MGKVGTSISLTEALPCLLSVSSAAGIGLSDLL